MNPAVSRGLLESNRKSLDLWFNGLQFLWKSEFQWPKRAAADIDDNDLEIKADTKLNALVMEAGLF